MADISKALKIGGWMSEAELQWLAEQAEKHSCIVEIGTFVGRSTRALGDNTPGRVFTFDKWQTFDEPFPSDPPLPPCPLYADEQIDIFRENMNGLLYDKVIPIMCDHKKLDWWNIEPDMVFIDGGHDYESVLTDIWFWVVKIPKGGLVCGHDYNDSWPSVKKAVDNLPGVSVVPGTSIWYKVR